MLYELLQEGGAVLWIILACGAASLMVYIERTLHLHRARILGDDFVKGIMNVVARGNISEALTICDETPGPVAYVVRRMIQHRRDGVGAMQEVVADASSAEVSRMERRLVVIATVAQIAPLLGLLGTVMGLYGSLYTMELQSPLTVQILDGLRKALVTTGAGLMVSIPCYAAFNLLVVKIDRLVLDIEKAVAEMMTFLDEQNQDADG